MLIGCYPGGEECSCPAVGGDLGAGLAKDAGLFGGAASTAFDGVADSVRGVAAAPSTSRCSA